MTTAAKQPGPAARRWGYEFGERGVVSLAKAAERCDCSERTIERRCEAGLLRKGYRKPGVPCSGTVICKRSLDEYLGSLES